MKKPLPVLAPIIAMILITALEVIAIANNLNGTILAAALALIAGLGGYTIGKTRKSQ